ncbi:MAG TPA: hypothetical protein GX506_04235 [Firmicutes bacterium]|nr:hypothetical protein [Bacillota bacterium]
MHKKQPNVQGLSFEKSFGLLLDQEWTYRHDRLDRLVHNAHKIVSSPTVQCQGR